MCNQLFQYYACGHSKSICLTPCPHALETGKRIPLTNNGTALARSSSTVSSSAPSIVNHDLDSLPSRLRTPRSPLSYVGSTRGQPEAALPSRSNSSNQLPPGHPSPVIAAPQTSPPRWTVANPDPPAPVPSTPALPDEELHIIEPNVCPYHFPRDLPLSNHPCIKCYFLPKWAHLADRYVKSYQEGHPLNKPEEAEVMSGIAKMREEFRLKGGEGQGQTESGREGLLNVFVHGNEGAGRVG